MQHDVLLDGPGRRLDDTLAVATVTLGFVFLFLANEILTLAWTFLAFLVVNVLGWLYVRRRASPFLRDANERYLREQDVAGIAKIRIYKGFLFGKWQWLRFSVGIMILVLLITVTLDSSLCPFDLPQAVFCSLLVAGAVTILEAWIWYKRFSLKIRWGSLDWLRHNGFRVSLRPEE
ncbi:MAG: hypothetical protein JSU74_04950 [Candidatus Zixiibacteriota bacterium]|nr:MAG: hypothetical protein JSU74_04950 [candidate division Zixibacteria bacterium]